MVKTSSRCRCTLMLLVLAVAVLTAAAHAQTFSVLYNFGSKAGDPAQPSFSGIIAQGRDGNLYSTTPYGGNGQRASGTVFAITPSGGLTVLYGFGSGEPGIPLSGLTLGTDGNFYGTTSLGGLYNAGSVFKITASGNIRVLHVFSLGGDGGYPYAPPVEGTDGNFYGTAYGGGGSANCGGTGCGTVYKITPSGKFTTLYEFKGSDGANPSAPLVQGTNGNFYGTTSEYDSGGYGTVFKITQAGKLTVLYNFDITHGEYPWGPLIQGSDGNFYGTTYVGGSSNFGVIFKISPTGKLTVLHNVNGTSDGAYIYSGLVQATDGYLYGVTNSGSYGSVYRISTTGKNFSILYQFDGITTGRYPYVTLLQHTNGTLYGDTQLGGSVNSGTFYSLSIGVGPFVSLMNTSGKVGKSVQILGQGFTGTTAVSFNGTPVTNFTVVSDTYLTAVVPSGTTQGFVSVTTPGGLLTSNKPFRVTPQILSFTPTSGPVTTLVTITGVSLTQTTKVTFGGVAASFNVNSDTQVTATVPTGAKTGKIAITTAGGTAVSPGIFTVTP